MGLIQDIGTGPVGIDTAVFIYFIEENPRYLPLIEPLFEAIDREELIAVTSTLTLLETLVAPLRAGDSSLAERYEQILSNGRGLFLMDIDRPLVRQAAEIRARQGLETPDALQVAAASRTGCSAFVTNDRKIPTSQSLRVLQLRDYL